MKNSITKEIIVSALILVLLAVLLNPFEFLMTTELTMMIIAAFIILLGFFAGLIWREGAEDEREAVHRMMADRVGFLAGGTILSIAAVWEFIMHDVDPWVIGALSVMVVAKVAARIYGKIKK